MPSARSHPHLVDAHCHVDLFRAPGQIVRRAERRGVYTIAVTTLPSSYPRVRGLVEGSRFVRPALGFHPELVSSHAHELPAFADQVRSARYVGEIGLDYVTPSRSERATQRQVLDRIVSLCDAAGGKVLSLHSRRAADDVIALFAHGFRGAWILHWFSGGRRAAERAAAGGAYFSVNSAMLASEAGRSLVAAVPRDRVLTESDGPFVESGGRPAEPAALGAVVDTLSAIWDTTAAEAADAVYSTFGRMLHGAEHAAAHASAPSDSPRSPGDLTRRRDGAGEE